MGTAGSDTVDERIFSQVGTWQDFDPAWLVGLAQEQLRDHPQIAVALAECKRCCPESSSYLRFIDLQRPKSREGPWHFATTVILRDAAVGEICLDLLTNGRIGGAEFLDRKGD